ncbi:hypothetical protein DM02DRAFT_676995 [Periconia macrospinosa]|uniref:Uncharacterized protein n=1 Tax=Periconia macrospinosa TaxID=97972 RepID=A0A2V1D7H4_9PLEO|nr:hypothetical protein DM02DRAFT_676995 [Periconia macrospinosa]
MSTSHSPSKGTPRRVLGDVAPKALNTPSIQGNAPRPSEGTTTTSSPLKQVSSLLPNASVDKENLTHPSPFLQTKKRTIYEVEDAENAGNAKAMFGAREPKMGWKNALTATGLERHTTSHPVDLPMPGSPTERNTPTPEPEEQTAQPHSQESVSFSNYIDYEQCASQKSEHPPPSPSPSPPPPTAEVKKEKSKAELLRTRLALGIYKVKTNQTGKRSSEIISSFEATNTPITSSTESIPPQGVVPSITLSTTTHSAPFVSVKANLDPGRPIGKLTPAPVLVPTAYSSRMAQDYNMESSPPQPQSVSPEQLMSSAKRRNQAQYMTPVPKRFREVEAHTEGVDAPLEERIERMRSQESRVDETPSSVGKGSAAKGLMDLKHGQR